MATYGMESPVVSHASESLGAKMSEFCPHVLIKPFSQEDECVWY